MNNISKMAQLPEEKIGQKEKIGQIKKRSELTEHEQTKFDRQTDKQNSVSRWKKTNPKWKKEMLAAIFLQNSPKQKTRN